MVTSILPRRERKKRETRDRILRAGLDAFTRAGFEAATVDQIAADADVGKGTVYNYFRTKEDIVIAFMIDIERKTQREVSKLAQGRWTLESTLTRFIHAQFKLKEPHYGFVRVFLAQLSGKATGQSEWVKETSDAMDPPLVSLFTTLQKRGVMRDDVDIATLVGAFKVMQLGLTILWAIEGPPWTHIDEAVRQQVRLFCSGIEAQP